MADGAAAKEAVNTALMAVQAEYADLEQTVVSVCQELEGEGTVSGSSVISRLRALGGRIAEHAKSTFRLGVLRALTGLDALYPGSPEGVIGVRRSQQCRCGRRIGHHGRRRRSRRGVRHRPGREAGSRHPPIAEFDPAEDPQRGITCR